MLRDDGLVGNAARLDPVLRGLLADLKAAHPSVGAVRNIGLHGIVELIRDRRTGEPLAPFNGSSPEMAAGGLHDHRSCPGRGGLGRFLRGTGRPQGIARWA